MIGVAEPVTVFGVERWEMRVDGEPDEIRRLCELATPGPRYVIQADDTFFIGLVGVATDRTVDGASANKGNLDATKMVAATLVQGPVRYVSLDDWRWDENAEFIAAARGVVPTLVEEVSTLRERVRELEAGGAVDGAPGE